MKTSPAWENYRKRMQEHIDKGDFTKPWEWSTVVATMFVGDGKIIRNELQEIRQSGVQAGSTWDDGDAHNLIHQRYHLLQWEKANPNKKISELKTVLEVGAGYGAMVILFSRLGFRGKYYIVDLPELERVQRQHLNWRDIKCRVKWRERIRPDLMIGIASLSEIPPEARRPFLDRIRPKSYIIGYQSEWDNVNNTEFFKTWATNFRTDDRGPSFLSFSDPNTLEYLISTEVPS